MRTAASIVLLLLPMVAAAQVYSWKDASGKVHYSDQPPAERSVHSRTLGPSNSTSDDAATASKAAADRRLEASKQAKESKDKAADAEKQRAEDAQRQQNCERARINMQGLESGQIRFRMTPSGEREALDGAVRDAELAQARAAVEAACSARPAASK
ncbi:MAG TPA: DUF4124 domain-containing protein [Rhodocyclaceae bacterium]|nr:DUF4124 domain-containing protein [Rhodocyclaceae bacterium]